MFLVASWLGILVYLSIHVGKVKIESNTEHIRFTRSKAFFTIFFLILDSMFPKSMISKTFVEFQALVRRQTSFFDLSFFIIIDQKQVCS